MDSDVLLIERGPVTTLTLNRPEKLNALDRELGNRFIDALTEEGLRPEVRVLVIAGAGSAFCSGDDVSGVSADNGYDRTEPLTYANLTHYYRMQSVMRHVPKPVIAKVHGYCLGAGMDIVCAADYAIVDSAAKLGLVFVRRAVSAGMVLLPSHVNLKQATRLLFEGDTITPAEALDLGLISSVAEPGTLDDRVCELAERLAAGPTRVYGYIKEGLNNSFFPGMEDNLRSMAFMQQFSTRTADSVEARAAWRERRRPQFTGR